MPGSNRNSANVSRGARDTAQNKRASGAPFGRYEDKSAIRASSATRKQIKRAGAEGPKKSTPVKKRGR